MVNFATRWIAANALGWAAGFPIFLLFTELVFGHDTHATALGGHVVGLAVFGVVVGACQALGLPRNGVDRRRWIAASALGFAAVNLVIAPLYFSKLWPAPGPVEPLVITFLAASFTSVVQASVARRVFARSRFIGFSVVGAAVGVATAAASMMALVEALRANLSWGVSMAIFGFVVGAVSGAITHGTVGGPVLPDTATAAG